MLTVSVMSKLVASSNDDGEQLENQNALGNERVFFCVGCPPRPFVRHLSKDWQSYRILSQGPFCEVEGLLETEVSYN